MRKLVLYISMSLDGYIATKNDDISWLSKVEDGSEDYGYEAFNETVDTYIVGRKTYDTVKELCNGEFPAGKRHKSYVITTRQKPDENCVEFYTGNLIDLVKNLKQQPGKNIYCDGGAEIVKTLMNHDLIDIYIVSVIPILLGDGKRLFKGETPLYDIELIDSTTFPSGLVQLTYERKKV